MALKINYVDDILNTDKNTLRKYNMIQNSDGTVSFEDVTDYLQIGDTYGSADINTQNKEINQKANKTDVDTSINSLNENLTNTNKTVSQLNSDKFNPSSFLMENIISDVLGVDLNTPNGDANRSGKFIHTSVNLPPNAYFGYRHVYFVQKGFVYVIAYVFQTDSSVSIYINGYNENVSYGWLGWKKIATDNDISNLKNIFLSINGGTTNGDINAGGKLLIGSDGEGGKVRWESPNNHHWEMDANTDSVFRLYHGIDNVTEVDNCFYFNSEDGRISSDAGVFALTSDIEKITSSTISSGYVNFTITKSANVKFIHASQILSTGMNSGTRYTIGGLGAGFLPSVNISQLIFTSINMKAFLIIDTNGTVIIEPETNMPAGTSFNLNFAYI